MRYIFILAMTCLHNNVIAQKKSSDSVSVLDKVTVSGIKSQSLKHSPFNIAVLSADDIKNNGSYNLCDALTKIPGVSEITTGIGVSKPVIRGLYGNRIQTVLLGQRFDNQQWQDEHGLGLSIIGIDRIEVLKGPSSLLYGTEAIGGVIKIVEEAVPAPHTKESDVSAALFSNTLGFSVDAGMKKNTGTKNRRLRFGADNHADYSDGDNHRVLNSRFESYNLKASLGYTHKRWTNQNNFYTSFSRFGFITNDNTDRKPVDGRAARKFDGPYHIVFFNILSTENSLMLAHSRLEINGGFSSNLRLENEGGNHISLNMLLNSGTYNVKWYKTIAKQTELVLGNESQYQVTTNYGSRVIIPDANLFETAVSGYIKKTVRKLDIETGLSFSERNISTKFTQNMDYSSGAIYPFQHWFPSLNGNAGISFNSNGINIKANLSSGYRSPNLAELSSNGLHEGTFRYEIGNPKMSAEQNLNSELGFNYESKTFDFYSTVYLNSFKDYVYLSPTGTQLYGFDIYRFLQGNAKLYGTELTAKVNFTKNVATEISYSNVTGKLASGKYLPFIQANKLVADIPVQLNNSLRLKAGADIISRQDHPGDFETPTAGYWLLHASAQWALQRNKGDIRFSVSGENLLNKAYYDHLSRFKYFGIKNPGRNITARVTVPFSSSKK